MTGCLCCSKRRKEDDIFDQNPFDRQDSNGEQEVSGTGSTKAESALKEKVAPLVEEMKRLKSSHRKTILTFTILSFVQLSVILLGLFLINLQITNQTEQVVRLLRRDVEPVFTALGQLLGFPVGTAVETETVTPSEVTAFTYRLIKTLNQNQRSKNHCHASKSNDCNNIGTEKITWVIDEDKWKTTVDHKEL